MKPASVYDAISVRPEAQKRYRESAEFREFIDALDVVLRNARETLSEEQYRVFFQHLSRMAKEEIAQRHVDQ